MAGRVGYYGGIVKEGLILDLDVSKVDSYPQPRDGNTLYDISGNGHDMTLINGPSYIEDDLTEGGVLRFVSTSDQRGTISHSSMSYDRSKFSIEVWAKYREVPTNFRNSFFSKWTTGAGTNNEFVVGGRGQNGPSPLTFTIQTQSSGILQAYNENNYYSINQWYNLIATFDGSNSGEMSVYINGAYETGKTTNVSSVKTYNVPYYTCAIHTNPTLYDTPANIAVIRMYSGKVLNASEVAQNYNALKGRFGL